MQPLRIALLTLEATAASRAVHRFVASDPGRIAMVGLSDPFRPGAGGMLGQTWKRLRASGPGLLPYLFVNFSLPRLVGSLPRRSSADPERRPLREACGSLGIPAVDVADVNALAFRQALAESGADLILTFHFDQILRADTIAATRAGGINVHPGLLPRHRGPVPTIHALLDDPVELGVSIHRLVPKIDAGDVLVQTTLPDRPGLTAIAAAGLLHEAALPLLETVLADLDGAEAGARTADTLPYRGFPTAAELGRLSARGRKTTGWRDVVEACRYPAT